MENLLVAFHIGRGGRYNNPGTIRFIDSGKSIRDYTDNLFINFENHYKNLDKVGDRENLINLLQDAVDNPIAEERLRKWGFDLGERIFVDLNGSPVGLTLSEAESGVGSINIDNEYDTTYVKYLGDCSESELQLILEQSFVDSTLIDYCNQKLKLSGV